MAEATAAEAVEAPTMFGNIMDGISTVGAVAGTLVLGGLGVSYYAQTTEELARKMIKGEQIPAALKERAPPLAEALEFGFEKLLEFRQWTDGQASFYLDPVSDKLLPDHPPNSAYIPHTLVLDLDDTLIKADWKRERGWRVFKRPGVDDFLKHMAQFYEAGAYTRPLFSSTFKRFPWDRGCV
jgi:import inner membrane translocase subunit TIM50